MSKAKVSNMSNRILNDTFDAAATAQRFPGNISGSMTVLQGYAEIDCDKIVEYQNKSDSDFKPWPTEQFQLLVESIRKFGVYEAVIVRPLKDKPGWFEMLAGEHRWKASMAAGKITVPARIIIDCDDTKAADIFSSTNVLRRENSIKDKINGWWHYFNLTRYKRKEEIEQLIAEGTLNTDVHEEAQKSLRTAYRFARMHDLIPELMDLVDQRKINLDAGEKYAHLSHTQQVNLLPYKSQLNNSSKAQQLKTLGERSDEADKRALLEGKAPAAIWNDAAIREILFPENASQIITLKEIGTKLRAIVGDKIDQSAYGDVERIVSEAIDDYLEQHPEFKKKDN